MTGCWNSCKSLKNLKVGVFETDFKQVPFIFQQATWPVENLLTQKYSKHFRQKFSKRILAKNCSKLAFWALNNQNWRFLVSRPTGRWDLRSHVCSSVRSYATLFLGNRSLLFSETLQWVRACRCEKNVPSAFLIIFTCPKWPFLPKWPKMEVFCIFSRTAHQNFLIFCSKHSLWSRKLITFSLFGGNFKNDPVWPKLTQIWPEFGWMLE